MGEYKDDPGPPKRGKRPDGYGQVQLYAYIIPRVHTSLKMTRDMAEILAMVSLCRTNERHATRGPVWHGERDVESIRVFSARVIDCVIC